MIGTSSQQHFTLLCHGYTANSDSSVQIQVRCRLHALGSVLSDISMSSQLEVKNVIASFCIPDTLEIISSASEERKRLRRVSPSAAESTQPLKMQVKRCNVCVISLSGDHS